MIDRRPLHAATPPDAAALGQEIVDALKPQLDRMFDDCLALPGSPAERVNDALSLVATIGGFVALQLAARLMLTKGAPPDLAIHVALEEIAVRVRAEFADATRRAGGRP